MTKIYLSQLLKYIANNYEKEPYAVIDMDCRDRMIFGKIDKEGEFLRYVLWTLNTNPIVYEYKKLDGFDEGVVIKCHPDV